MSDFSPARVIGDADRSYLSDDPEEMMMSSYDTYAAPIDGMEDLAWAMAQAEKWIAVHGGHATGVFQAPCTRRWFLRVVTSEPNWDHERNLYVTREAELGEPTQSDE